MGLIESRETAIVVDPKLLSGTWWDIAGYPATGCSLTKIDINTTSNKAKLSCLDQNNMVTGITDTVLTFPGGNRIDLTYSRNSEAFTFEVAVIHYSKSYIILGTIGFGEVRILSRSDKITKEVANDIVSRLKALDINTSKIVMDPKIVV